MSNLLAIKRSLSIFILAGIFNFAGYGQVDIKWEKELPADILWQEVTALGNLIVSTKGQLTGINTETGGTLWTKPDLGGIGHAAYSELPNSPFFTVTNGTGIYAIDQLSGDLVFDSRKVGISAIDDYFFLYKSNEILVAGKDQGGDPLMASVNMSTGDVSWTLKEKFGRIIAVNELGNNELLLVTLFNNYKLDAQGGKVIWKAANSSESAQMDKMGAFGDLMKNMAETMVEDMDIDIRFFRPPGSDIFYLGSQEESTSGFTSSTGAQSVNYINAYNAYNINDGNLVWDKPLESKGKIGHVVFLENGILVLPDDGNRTKINLFDYKTREGKWGKKGKGIPIKGGIYDYMDAGNGLLLVTQTASKNFLNFLDPSTGTITFEKPVKVDGYVVGIVPLSNGILYITTESMNILDPAKGVLKWSKSIQTTPELTARFDGKIYAYDTKSKTLKVVDEQSEKASEVSDYELKFLGGESPRKLEVLEDGIFVYSDQNVAKFGFDGTVKFQEYYPAPREPGWKRALLYAEAIRGAYIGATSYYVSGVMAAAEENVKQEDAFAGEVVNQMGNAYGELGDAASDYAVNAFKQANERHKATMSGRDFMFIMSKQDKNIALLKVSKSTGKVEGTIDLGKDREPVYAVDDITAQIYYRSENNTLTSYKVQ
jgi:hypothetical protein